MTITEAARLAAASQLLLILALLLRDHRRSRVTLASSVLVACVVCYLALPTLMDPAVPALVRRLAQAGALAVPFALWLTARLYFDDSFQTKPLHAVVLLALLGIRALLLPWPLAAAAIGIALVVDALRQIHTGADSDLLVSRLRLRYVIVIGSGFYALLVLIGEATVTRGSQPDVLLSAANDVGLFVLVGTIAMMVLRVDPELVRPARRPVPSAETHSILERRLERLIQRPRWARGRRLQPAEPGRERLAWDITYSLSTVVIFSAIGLALLYAQRAGLTRIYTAVADNGWAYLWASVLVATVAHDAYFYWTHRLLHWHPLFRLAHRVHHRSTNPTPWARMPSIR